MCLYYQEPDNLSMPFRKFLSTSRQFGEMAKVGYSFMGIMYERIDALRKEKGIRSLLALANQSGVSYGSLGGLKAGTQQVLSAENTEKIAAFFDVSTAYLLGNTDNPRSLGRGLDAIFAENSETPIEKLEGTLVAYYGDLELTDKDVKEVEEYIQWKISRKKAEQNDKT